MLNAGKNEAAVLQVIANRSRRTSTRNSERIPTKSCEKLPVMTRVASLRVIYSSVTGNRVVARIGKDSMDCGFGHPQAPAWIARQTCSLGKLLKLEGKPQEKRRIWPS